MKWLSLGAQGSVPIVDQRETPDGTVHLLRQSAAPDAEFIVRDPSGMCNHYPYEMKAKAVAWFMRNVDVDTAEMILVLESVDSPLDAKVFAEKVAARLRELSAARVTHPVLAEELRTIAHGCDVMRIHGSTHLRRAADILGGK